MTENKVVTICGSMKFQSYMIKIAEQLEIENGYVVIQCIYEVDISNYTEKDIEILSKLHYKKIDISDAIYVVNIGNYIGDQTSKEIKYAKDNGKEVIYHI